MAKTNRRARKTSAFYMPSAFDLFKPSKNIVLSNIWIFAPLYAVSFIFWLHSWIWSPTLNSTPHWYTRLDGLSPGWTASPLPTYSTFLVVGFSLFWFLIILVAGSVAQMMSHTAQLYGAERKNLGFDKLWLVVKEVGWRLIGLYAVVFLAVVIGLILLIVPGLIMIRRYYLAPYVLIDTKCGIREAMDESARLSKMNTGSIWGIIGVMFLIGLVNIIPVFGGLVSFALGGLYSAAPALRYTQLRKLA
jgi:hypothetical protein